MQHQFVNATKINLLVKWAGYKDPEWSTLNIDLKRHDLVKEYLKLHDLQRYGLKRSTNAPQPEDNGKRVRFSDAIHNEATETI